MYFHEFQGVRISAMAAAVPDAHEKISDFAGQFPEDELEKFCRSTGIQERYYSANLGITSADLCVTAAEEIFCRTGIDRNSIDGLVFLTQSPDYLIPPHRVSFSTGLGWKTAAWSMTPTLAVQVFLTESRWPAQI